MSSLIDNIEIKQIHNSELKEKIDKICIEHEELFKKIQNEKIRNESLLNRETTINNNIMKKRKEENMLLKQVHEKAKENERKLSEQRITIMTSIEELNNTCNMLTEQMHFIEMEYEEATKKEDDHRKNHCDEFDKQFDKISTGIVNFQAKNDKMTDELKLATIDYDYLQNKVYRVQANKFGLTQILNKKTLLQPPPPQQEPSKMLTRGNSKRSKKRGISKMKQCQVVSLLQCK